MTSSPLTSSGGIIDNKLQHLIHKIIKSSTASKSTSSSTQIVYSNQVFDTLLTKHREYKRKNSSTLQTQIDEILISFAKNNRFKTRICSKSGSLVIQSIDTKLAEGGGRASVVVPIGQQHVSLNRSETGKDNSNYSTNNHTDTCNSSDQIVINTAVGNKRKRNPESQLNTQNQQQNNICDSSDEEEYDKAATQNDLIMVQSLEDSGSSSMLNANLRNRYKDVQRERDIIARKKAKATAEEEKLAKANTSNAESSNDHSNSCEKILNNMETDNNNIETKQGSTLPSIPEISSDQSEKIDTETINNPTSSVVPSTPSTTIGQNINTPLKKKKKRITKSSSSNSLSKLDNISSEQSSSIFMTSPTPRPKERYSDLGGITDTMTQIRQLIEYPLSHPELFAHLGIHPPRGMSFAFLIVIMFQKHKNSYSNTQTLHCIQVFYSEAHLAVERHISRMPLLVNLMLPSTKLVHQKS